MKFLLRATGAAAFWLSWPLSYFHVRHTARTRVLVRAGDQVLVVQVWHGTGIWSLPGGGMHAGEMPLQAAVRELREETGLEAAPQQLEALGLRAFSYAGMVFTCHYYYLELSEPQTLKPGRPEIIDARWLPERRLHTNHLAPDVKQGVCAQRAAK